MPIRAAMKIDWSTRPAADLARGVRLALAVGAHLFARNLASRGANMYPDHQELQKMAVVLGPPRVVREIPSDPSVRANQAWLRDHADEYRGQWVAIRDGELLAVGETAREARNCLDSGAGVMLTRVF
ncbi:MAG: DUF5678 domain-containing protein [Anaerolineae bacterium]